MKHTLTLQALLLSMLLFWQPARAQFKDQPPATPSIKVVAKAGKGEVMLRWAPDSPAAWSLLNKHGYRLERFTLVRNGKKLDSPEKKVLIGSPQKPEPLATWEKVSGEDDYAAIMAQAIYGETFELSEGYSSDIMQVVNKSRELEQRYSFALFSADLSQVAAQKAALAYVDNTVVPGERYVYRVYSAVPSDILQIEMGFAYVGLEDYRPLPKPSTPEAEFGDLSVMLKWNKLNYESIYTAYKVERSDDGGKSFKPISQLPVVNTAPSAGAPGQWVFKSDSLPLNDKAYAYRIIGLTPFGEAGPPSGAVTGMGRDRMEAHPAITKAEVLGGQAVRLEWFFDSRYDYQVKGFSLSRASAANGTYETIVKDIAVGTRLVVDKQPTTTNYYKVSAIGKHGQETSSMPYLVQLVDSIPPSQPKGLTGKVDTTGLVTLSWAPNNESDLLGYRVFRSNFEGTEFTQVTVSPVIGNTFYDTIPAKAITAKVFYKVKAVDRHYNPSAFSEAAGLVRPDIVPPVPPVFIKVEALKEGIHLEWEPSSSHDVKDHLLYRKQAGASGGWALVAVFSANNPVKAYTDTKIGLAHYYEYTMIAVDHGQLESAPAKPVRARRIDTGIRESMVKLYAQYDNEKNQINLAWEYEGQQIDRFLLYRASDDIPMSPFKAIDGSEQKFSDSTVKQGKVYQYQVKAIFSNGTQSKFSEKVSVETGD